LQSGPMPRSAHQRAPHRDKLALIKRLGLLAASRSCTKSGQMEYLSWTGGRPGWRPRAQGDQVLTFQMSLGIPNPAGEGGLRGTADGQFVFPKGIAIDSTGRFIVADTESYEGLVVSSNRIQISGRMARWRESLVAPATCQVSSGIQPVWRWTRAIGLS